MHESQHPTASCRSDALPWVSGRTCPTRDVLCDVERQLRAALVAARESITRCEQALAVLADARVCVPVEPRATRATAAQRAPGPPPQPAHDNGDRAVTWADHLSRLSPREVQVLHRIAAGLSNRQIAESLFLSPRTVERHIANIYLKLDVHSKAEAIAVTLRGRLAEDTIHTPPPQCTDAATP